MSKRIFRDEALARLSSPEQLDQVIEITSPRSWLVLLALFALLVGLTCWSIFGRVTTRVQARGILLGGDVFEVVPPLSSGQLLKLYVAVGEQIEEGQPVADVDQPELRHRVSDAAARLQELRDSHAYVAAFVEREIASKRDYVAGRREALIQSIRDHRDLLQLLLSQLEAEQGLLADGQLAASNLVPTRDKLSETRDRLERAQAELHLLSTDELTTEFEARQRLIQSEQDVHEAERRLGQLEQEYRLRSRVLSPYDGQVLDVMVDPGSVVTPGQPLMRLGLSSVHSELLRAVLFIPRDEGKRVTRGMHVQIAPGPVKPEQHGYIRGVVSQVDEFPATTQSMQNLLKNDQLVADLSSSGPTFKLEVELLRDPREPARFVWTSGRGPAAISIDAGTPALGLVIVEERAPIELVVPTIKKKLSLL